MLGSATVGMTWLLPGYKWRGAVGRVAPGGGRSVHTDRLRLCAAILIGKRPERQRLCGARRRAVTSGREGFERRRGGSHLDNANIRTYQLTWVTERGAKLR